MPLHSAPHAFFVSGRIHPSTFYCQPATEIRSNDKKLFLTCEKNVCRNIIATNRRILPRNYKCITPNKPCYVK